MQTISAIVTKIKNIDKNVGVYSELNCFVVENALNLGLDEISIVEVDDIYAETGDEVKQNINNFLSIFKDDCLIYTSLDYVDEDIEADQKVFKYSKNAIEELGFKVLSEDIDRKISFIYLNDLGKKFLSLIEEMEDNE